MPLDIKITEDDIIYINYVWCKFCASNKTCVLNYQSVKGTTRISIECFIKKTSNVTNHAVSNILQHLKHIYDGSF